MSADNDKKFRKPRIWSNNELKKVSHLFSGDIVNISAGDDIDKQGAEYRDYFPQARSYTISNFSGHKYRGFKGRPREIELDLEANIPQHLKEAFDVVFNHTTLEHIFDVRMAVHNLCSLSRDIVIVVVPFCQVQHETAGYLDYWRFSPTCLRQMFKQEGFSIAYQACNNEFNTSVYILMIATKAPEKWVDILPIDKMIEPCGKWVGNPLTLKGMISILVAYLRHKTHI
jgi:hypothetical protein